MTCDFLFLQTDQNNKITSLPDGKRHKQMLVNDDIQAMMRQEARFNGLKRDEVLTEILTSFGEEHMHFEPVLDFLQMQTFLSDPTESVF